MATFDQRPNQKLSEFHGRLIQILSLLNKSKNYEKLSDKTLFKELQKNIKHLSSNIYKLSDFLFDNRSKSSLIDDIDLIINYITTNFQESIKMQCKSFTTLLPILFPKVTLFKSYLNLIDKVNISYDCLYKIGQYFDPSFSNRKLRDDEFLRNLSNVALYFHKELMKASSLASGSSNDKLSWTQAIVGINSTFSLVESSIKSDFSSNQEILHLLGAPFDKLMSQLTSMINIQSTSVGPILSKELKHIICEFSSLDIDELRPDSSQLNSIFSILLNQIEASCSLLSNAKYDSKLKSHFFQVLPDLLMDIYLQLLSIYKALTPYENSTQSSSYSIFRLLHQLEEFIKQKPLKKYREVESQTSNDSDLTNDPAPLEQIPVEQIIVEQKEFKSELSQTIIDQTVIDKIDFIALKSNYFFPTAFSFEDKIQYLINIIHTYAIEFTEEAKKSLLYLYQHFDTPGHEFNFSPFALLQFIINITPNIHQLSCSFDISQQKNAHLQSTISIESLVKANSMVVLNRQYERRETIIRNISKDHHKHAEE